MSSNESIGVFSATGTGGITEAQGVEGAVLNKRKFYEAGHGSKSRFVSHTVIPIQPGEKLLWQKNRQEYGWDLNRVDASVQEK